MKSEHFKLTSAVHLFLIEHSTILLARRANTGYEDGNYSVPAGHLDGGESIKQAMAREAREEVDLIIEPKDLILAHVMHRNSDSGGGERIDFFFRPDSWKGSPRIMESKCDELRWSHLYDLPENTIPYIRSAIENYCKGVLFSEFGW